MIKMNTVSKWGLTVLTIFLFSHCKKNAKKPTSGSDTELKCTEKSPFAVVEFFTSEGIKACVNEINFVNGMVTADSSKNILYIAEHIDYANGPMSGPCGTTAWVDPYSDSLYKKRQIAYGLKFNWTFIVAPQYMFGGQTGTTPGTVPMTQSAIKAKISEQYAATASSGITIRQSSLDEVSKKIKVEYAGLDLPSDCSLVLWLVESGLKDSITGGENCNLILMNKNVSRKSQTILNPGVHGFSEIAWDANIDLNNTRIMAFVTDNTSLKIVAGTTGFGLKK